MAKLLSGNVARATSPFDIQVRRMQVLSTVLRPSCSGTAQFLSVAILDYRSWEKFEGDIGSDFMVWSRKPRSEDAYLPAPGNTIFVINWGKLTRVVIMEYIHCFCSFVSLYRSRFLVGSTHIFFFCKGCNITVSSRNCLLATDQVRGSGGD